MKKNLQTLLLLYNIFKIPKNQMKIIKEYQFLWIILNKYIGIK